MTTRGMPQRTTIRFVNAKEIFKNMNKTSNTQVEVSLSDEKKYARIILIF